jgi:hypothetical protein
MLLRLADDTHTSIRVAPESVATASRTRVPLGELGKCDSVLVEDGLAGGC